MKPVEIRFRLGQKSQYLAVLNGTTAFTRPSIHKEMTGQGKSAGGDKWEFDKLGTEQYISLQFTKKINTVQTNINFNLLYFDVWF